MGMHSVLPEPNSFAVSTPNKHAKERKQGTVCAMCAVGTHRIWAFPHIYKAPRLLSCEWFTILTLEGCQQREAKTVQLRQKSFQTQWYGWQMRVRSAGRLRELRWCPTMVDTDLRRDANEWPCPTWDTVYFETTHKHHKSEAGCQARAWLYDGVRMFSKNQQYSGVQQELRKLVERGH